MEYTNKCSRGLFMHGQHLLFFRLSACLHKIDLSLLIKLSCLSLMDRPKILNIY